MLTHPLARTLIALAVTLAALPAEPAHAQKRPLTIDDFDGWMSVDGERLSDDGRWLVYTLTPQVGEGFVVVRSADGSREFRHSRGFIGRPNQRPGADRDNLWRAPAARFTADARHVLFTIEPTREAYEAAQRARGRNAPRPTTSLGILRTADGNVEVIERVKSFRAPDESGRWLAYLLEPDTAAAAQQDTAAPPAVAATPGEEPRPVADSASTAKKKKTYGSTFVIRDLDSGVEARVEDVVAFEFNEEGRHLAYTVSSRAAARDGAYLHDLAAGTTQALLGGEGEYRALSFDEAGRQLAFVSNRDTYASDEPRFTLYHATVERPTARAIATGGALADSLIVADRLVGFSENGRVLTFGVRRPPLDSIPADSLADKAVFDLWHWKDARLQPQQRLEANRDRERAHLAVHHLDGGRTVVLGDNLLESVRLSDDGLVAVATTDLPYAVQSMWGDGATDLYVIDTRTGERTLVAEALDIGVSSLSPEGRWVAFFDDGAWHAYDVRRGERRDLTGGLENVSFDRETWDTPSTPAPWGLAGWTEGDRSLLVYDRYDVWSLDPAGRRPARVVTDSLGRRQTVELRVVDLDPEEDAIPTGQPLLLAALDEETKQSGFWRDQVDGTRPPERIIMDDVRFGSPSKAEDADRLLWTRSTVSEFPDVWVSDMGFQSARKLSDANPQQASFLWPGVELVEWRSADGIPLRGLLYKPEGFDPSKKYPMAVYFYEQLSDNLHAYNMATPRNLIHPTLYASQGYLVFEPDIAYQDGYPGPSAYKAIVPGVQSLIARGFVDEDAIGIGGQSWGGYQTAWIITQTNLFAAAMAGAPVANMTSAYGGIRWGSGRARAFQYEVGQSRIGGSLWEHPWRYIENSPLFAADRIETPLLMMHNDNDGAVPWYQGIELFVAMRRLGKEVYLFNYNGDEHNPVKRANQLDIALRMLQFFDHHLKGAPAPEWMKEGIPFLEKGRDQLKAKVAEEVAGGR